MPKYLAFVEKGFYQSAMKAVNSYGYLSLDALVNSQINHRLIGLRQHAFKSLETQITV